LAVRFTESRLPAGFNASDLGQGVVATTNANMMLVSFQATPIARERIQQYFVIVADQAIAATVASYEWSVNDAGTAHVIPSTIGKLEYTPVNLGTLTINVRLLNTSNGQVAALSMQQTVVALNVQLEQLIDQQDNIPAAAHPTTSREIINDLRVYADGQTVPAIDPRYNKLLLSLCYSSILGSTQISRNAVMETHCGLFNNHRSLDFLARAESGIGINKIRPQLLAMVLDKPGTPGTPYIPFTELTGNRANQQTILTGIQSSFNALSEEEKLNLFNLCRFPKTSFRMAKLILDKLRDRYFSAFTFDQLLADAGHRDKVKTILTQYENGPKAIPPAPALSTTSGRIYALLPSQVWAIPAATASGGTGTGTAPAGTSAAAFGAPEHIPEANMTFVAEPRATDNGFIRTAFLYHETYGLNPRNIQSIEHLITLLSQSTAAITRMRLVSHFFLDDAARYPSHLNMAFFTPASSSATTSNAPPYSLAGHFKFGISDEEGIAFLMGEFFPRIPGHISDGSQIPFNPAQPAATDNILNVVLRKLRISNQAVLVPFSLQGDASTASGTRLNFIKFCIDKLYINNVTLELANQDNTAAPHIPLPPLARTAILNYLDSRTAAVGSSLVTGNVTTPQVEALRDAIVTLSLNSLPVPIPDFGGTFFSFPGIYLANHNSFRTQLAAVKNRFSSTSIIDIRGCRIGQDPLYMQAFRDFFGNTGSQPIITCPDWFQSFPFMGGFFPANDAGIDGVVSGGFSVNYQPATGPPATVRVTGTDVQREYSNWSGRAGTPSHLSFWTRFTTADPLEFLSYDDWKNNIPGLALEAVRMAGFPALDFTAAVQRLALIFSITGAAAPAQTVLQNFSTAILPSMQNLRQSDVSISQMNTSTPVPELTTRLQALTVVAGQLSQTLPAAANPVTLAHLQTCLQQLKTFVTTQLNIAPFLQAMAAKLAAPNAGVRYLLNIGLPLPVQAASREAIIAIVMLATLRDDAIKSWMKSQWAEPLPSGSSVTGLSINWTGNVVIPNAPGFNDDDLTDLGKATQVAALNYPRNEAEFVVGPMYEYQQHIKSLP
jgi:hypothetical protein